MSKKSAPIGLLGAESASTGMLAGIPSRVATRGMLASQFTPQEQAIIDYHRKSLQSGNWLQHADGSPTTVLIGGVDGPDGRVYMVPFFDNTTGKILTPEEARARWDKEIRSGVFPVDDTGKEHNKRANRLHKQIEGDMSVLKRRDASYKETKPFNPLSDWMR